MDAKQFRNGIGTLNWNYDFYRFCREILETEPRFQDVWQREMWDAWQSLTKAIGRFDDSNLQRILDLAIRQSES
jgi:hypothetical protein